MKFIEEVVVEEFLPTYRSMLAERLRERGFTQAEVADALGISQSAVSKYVHGRVSRNETVAGDERVRELADRVADGLADGTMTPVGALVESEVLIRRLEAGDLLADLHEAAVPALREVDADLAIHDPESAARTTERVRSSVRRGLRTLTNASGFAALIPDVGSNLVECLPEPAGIEDVCGVPGRIFDVKGRATVAGEPEFGVSEHVASVVLAVRAAGADVRAAVNLRYDESLIEDLAAAGHATVEFDAAADAAAVEDALAGDVPGGTFALYHTGDYGIEPITYVLGPDAPTVAGAVRDLL